MKETDAAYIAGLFDGEGSVTHKKYNFKRGKKYYDTWAIELCIEMTDESVLRWVHEVLQCGSLNERKKSCLLYTSPSPRDLSTSRMPSSA